MPLKLGGISVDLGLRALELGLHLSRQYRESEERFRALNDRLPALVLSDAIVTVSKSSATPRLARRRQWPYSVWRAIANR